MHGDRKPHDTRLGQDLHAPQLDLPRGEPHVLEPTGRIGNVFGTANLLGMERQWRASSDGRRAQALVLPPCVAAGTPRTNPM